MMGNQQYLSIKKALEDAADDFSLKGAERLAHAVQPELIDLIGIYGADSEEVKAPASEVGARLLANAVYSINQASSRFQSDKIEATQYLKVLRAAESVIGYVAQLPASEDLHDTVNIQKEKLSTLTEKTEEYIQRHSNKKLTWEKTDSNIELPKEDKPRNKKRIYIISSIVIALTLAISYFADIYNEYRKLNDIKANYTEEAVMAYLSDKANTHYDDEALDLYLSRMDSILLDADMMKQPTQYPPLARMDNFGHSGILNQRISETILRRVEQRTDSLYAIAKARNDIKGWYEYQAQAPSRLYLDSSERIDSLETIAWSNESTAWDAAMSTNDKDAYIKYLDLYADGAHTEEAHAKLIDIEVNSYRNRNIGEIKEIERIGKYPGKGSRIAVFNHTDYDMEFLFSGPMSKRMNIPPGESEFLDLDNGDYKILVKIDSQLGDKFSFEQKFEDGIYSSSISSSK